jgi:hypothetical protein
MAKSVTNIRYPKIAEIFELGIDGDAMGNRPLEMVRRAGHDPRGWAHNGPLFCGRAIRPFQLAETNSSLSFDGVISELSQRGRVPEGQWCLAFKVTYPKPDVERHVAIADATWIGPDGRTYFPYISRAGDLRFHRSTGVFGEIWLWIVATSV